MTASTAMTWAVLAHLRRRGVQVTPWLAAQGIQISKLLSPDSRMTLRDLRGLWRAAVDQCSDRSLGVRIAMQFDPLATVSWSMPFSLLEHIGIASASLRDAMLRQRPYLRLLRDGFTLGIEDWQDERPLARWEFANLQQEPPELIEFQMAMGLILTRRITRNPTATPQEVWFSHEAPPDLTPHITLFGRPPRFGAPCNGMVMSAPAIDAPLRTHDPAFLSVCEYRAHKLLHQLPSIEDFAASVRQHIEAELPHGNTTASAVAEKLGISARTLHRRLNAQHSTYQQQLDQVRFRLATGYLTSRRYHLGEVASLVGFAQQSAFQRAFKTWAGETPAEYQQRHVGVQTTSRARARTA